MKIPCAPVFNHTREQGITLGYWCRSLFGTAQFNIINPFKQFPIESANS